MYKINILTPTLFEAFEHTLIFPNKLQSVVDLKNAVAIGASYGENPIGIAVVKFQKQEAELISLYVEPEFRRKKIATALLQNLEKMLREKSCHTIFFSYVNILNDFESLLLSHGWYEEPVVTIIYTHKGKGTFCNLKTFEKCDYCVDLFVNISEKEKKWLIDHPEISPRELHPFNPWDDAPIEPLNSLILRKNDEIKGWMITHRIAENAIRYTQLFVMKEERGHLAGPRLIAEAARLHHKVFDLIPKAVWMRVNRKMVDSFLEKNNCFPYKESFVVLKQIQKNL